MEMDNFICEYCNTSFSNQKNLTYHVNNAKYCLKLQGKSNDKYKCNGCEKSFTTKTWLVQHQQACLEYQLNRQQNEANATIDRLQKENSELKEMMREMIQCLRRGESVENIERKMGPYAIRKEREKYPANVVYILTTPAMEGERVYVFGKTKNLTNRLSVYNKGCEHTVVYYRACKTEEDMDVAEKMIFHRLAECRPDKNRERFVLPAEKTIDYFKEAVDACVDFFGVE